MIGKIMLVVFLHLSLLACAQPKYEVVRAQEGNLSQQENVMNCEIKFRNSNYCLLWSWENKPTASQAGSLTFKVVRANLLDGSAVPVDLRHLQAEPQLILWMPSMGHGSTPTHLERVDVGTYRVKEVFFIMPGDWELRFQFKEGEEVSDEAVVSLII